MRLLTHDVKTHEMSAYTNPTNIFNAVPHVVLQWVLSPFLVAEERGNLNAVLEPTESISRQLGKDVAIVHVLRAIIAGQRIRANDINDLNEQRQTRDVKLALGRAIARYVAFMRRPLTATLFQYRAGAKAAAMSELEMFLSDDYFGVFTTRSRYVMRDVLDHVKGIQFIRHVGGKKI